MREKEQAQAACALWPTSPDISGEIQQLTRELHISDVPRNTHGELERVHPSGEDDTEQTSRQPPAAGLISRQQGTYFIPPPSRAVGWRERAIGLSEYGYAGTDTSPGPGTCFCLTRLGFS